MYRNEGEWIEAYKNKGALWMHNGNPSAPHVKLTSGNHSDGFFNSRLVIADEKLLGEAAADLVELFAKQGGDYSIADCIVGPQTGATKLSELISDHIYFVLGQLSFSASPAKCEREGKKAMHFNEVEKSDIDKSTILLCEDVCTTGGSVDLTAEEVERCGGKVLPYVLVLVNRSGLKEINGRKIIALINRPMPIWTPDECKLCKVGSVAIPAKDNWQKLNSV